MESIMQFEEYLDFLGPREIKLKGHRVWIEHVLHEYLHRDMTLEDLVKRFDTLRKEQLLAVLLYYHRHKDVMDRYMTGWLEEQRRARHEDAKRRPEFYEKLGRLIADATAAQPRSA
jgi:uncharacterized protein (DUF433 family)